MEELIADLITRARRLTRGEDLVPARLLRAAADRLEPGPRATTLARTDAESGKPALVRASTFLADTRSSLVFGDGDIPVRDPNGWWRPEYVPEPPLSDEMGTIFQPDAPPYLPASTPMHPGAPMILSLHPKFGAIELPTFVNGWCAMGWIVRTKNGGSSSLAAADEKAQTLLSVPTQKSLNGMADRMIQANQILYDQCGIALRLCEVYELDARRLLVTGGNDTVSLADTYTGSKLVIGATGQRPDFFGVLNDLFNDRGTIRGTAEPEMSGPVKLTGAAVFAGFANLMRRPCLHLFFVNDVEDAAQPDAGARETRGVNGKLNVGAKKDGKVVPTSVCVVESDDKIAPIIAHEIAHALSLPHAEDDTSNDMRGDMGGTDNLLRKVRTGTKLRPSQCRRMLDYLQKNVEVACPH